MSAFRRGEVWVADLNPQCGTEPGKKGPVLIVQARALLDAGHASTLVAPLTTQLIDDATPLRVRIPAAGELHHDSDVLIDQLRAIDNRRLLRRLTEISGEALAAVERGLTDVLQLP